MLFLSHILLMLISVYTVFSSDEKTNLANVENLKILRKSVNFAYKIGNDFLDLIRGSTPPEESMKLAMELSTKENFRLNDFIPIYMPYIGFFILLAIGVLFLVLMPIVGLWFCLCRCCGKCGGKVKGMDPKYATCKRYTYAALLGMISIVMLGGIILAFINNQLIHDTLTNPSEEINVIKQMTTNSKMLRNSLINISEEISISEKSVQYTKNNDEKIDKIDFVIVILKRFDRLNSRLKDNMDKLITKLSDVTDYLQKAKKPNTVLENQNKKLISVVGQLQDDTMRDKLRSFLNSFDPDFKVLKNLMKSTDQNQPLSSTGSSLKSIVAFYNSTISNNLELGLANYDKTIKIEYLEYRLYICIGVCCLLLLIVLFYFLGLCFGQCGERPFEDARICNRGVGANLMMAGVAFTFLFTPLIMIFTMVLFMYGGMVQTDVCRYLTNSCPPGVKVFDSMFKLITKQVKLVNDEHFKTFKSYNHLNSIINNCQSMPMAKAFDIHGNILSKEVIEKISDISNKIKLQQTVYSNFRDFHQTLNDIVKEINRYLELEDLDQDKIWLLKEKLTTILTVIKSFTTTLYEKQIILSFETTLYNISRMALTDETKSVFSKIYIDSYKNVKCVGLHNSTKMIIETFCVTFIWPFNGFWYGIGICLVFTIPVIIFAVKLAGLYRHTEKYSADYEEPDYHSYMGFYTNNADNIPMKKPKSGKVNQKNRNSNSNNKNSLKQTNPQYLPVYPYDAYE